MRPAELLERETDLLQAPLSGDSLEVAHAYCRRFNCELFIPKMTGTEDTTKRRNNQYLECLT